MQNFIRLLKHSVLHIDCNLLCISSTSKYDERHNITACCSWKSGKVKSAYKDRHIHANVVVDMFEYRVCAAVVLRFVVHVLA